MMQDRNEKVSAVGGRGGDQLGGGTQMLDRSSWTLRQVALSMMSSNTPPLSERAGSFLGQLAVTNKSSADLSAKQREWLQKLIDTAGVAQREGSE
jgi:hypothetical protein